MSRALALGNGNILVCADLHGQLRDFYFHYVGLENQMYQGCVARVGLWIDGIFSWLDSPDWRVVVDYKYESLIGSIIAQNQNLEVELAFADFVYNEKNIYIRNATIKNLSSRARVFRLFFAHEFHIYENPTGDTGYFDQSDNTIVHYKGRRVMVVGGQNGTESFGDFTVGVFGIEGKEGSFKDAEDGVLNKNTVEHGPVDSVVGFEKHIEANSNHQLSYWICIAKSLEEAKNLHSFVLEKTPLHLEKTTHDFWRAWVNKSEIDFNGLDRATIDLFKKSLLIIRTHIDNTGAIIASGDSDMLQYGKDTYSYVWQRDASMIAFAMDNAGYSESVRPFFEFCSEVLSEDGYFYHKYRADKSLGSSWHPWSYNGVEQLPIQEDETALVIYSLWNHYQKSKNLEFIESIYNPMIKKAANFMLGFRDKTTGLPAASYDLWEMKNGISTFTASSVVGALEAACRFAQLMGKDIDAQKYKTGAEEIRQAIIKYLWNEELSFFYKGIEVKEGKVLHDKTIDASSFYGVWKFGVLPIDDEKLQKSFEVLKNKLWCDTPIGGVARFENDIYYRSATGVPGNAWFIATAWLIQYEIENAKTVKELHGLRGKINWFVNHALPSGVLSEQLDPHTGIQLSASPLIWSHAEYVTSVLAFLNKQKALIKNEEK